ncbi:protein ALP1-like protein [Cinnamomum micranthum f. kanehirae]|uniref:Protein ALP1-like protein n=1 Tax=Cinnamomum micranthum f. kanehirae TaxID=337451 RepID=A0A443N6R2_9MAGN|nr:protein ALP1-like protein [Cinnamomum micranthum f. kanehirae]
MEPKSQELLEFLYVRMREHHRVVERWEQRRRTAIVQLVCNVVHLLAIWHSFNQIRDMPVRNDMIGRSNVRRQVMSHLMENERICRDVLQMNPSAFAALCDKLRSTGLLKDFSRSTIEEQVAKFLHVLGQNWKYRAIGCYFCRSSETISRHFHNVLRAIISLENQFLKQSYGIDVAPQILHSSRFDPYFKDCIGAIDGTHVRVKVSRADAPRFRGRKDWPTQNVLAACSFDMRFTYVLPGWEGTASDSRIMRNALVRQNKLIIPQGKFFLVDAGFMLKSGLITPYRGVRYHLKEYSSHEPENEKELFNLRHASLRNVIERAFGVLKKRFPIIASGNESYFSVDTTSEIILACCILHNFLMGVDPDEHLIHEVDRELQNGPIVNSREGPTVADEDSRLGAALRDNIAARMWNDYNK